MDTSAIRYRVADFLKQHPPFDAFSETDRLALVAHGRVRFHEVDEYLYWQGRPHGPHVFVIQQGTASLWDEAGEKPRLVDVRGPGDLLGVDRFLGQEAHRHSARAMSDLVLYALPAADLEPLLHRHPEAALFLAAHFTVNAHPDPTDPQRRAHEKVARDFLRPEGPVLIARHETLAAAARRLLDGEALAAAVVDGDGGLAGLLDPRVILDALARGDVDPRAPVAQLLATASPPPRLASRAALDACLFALAEADAVAVTEEESGTGRLVGILTRGDLAPAFGEQPADLLREAARASSLPALRSARERLRHLLLDQLGTPRAVDFAARLAARFDRVAVERVLRLTGSADPGLGTEDEGRVFFLFGASGRGESLTALPPQVGLIHPEGEAAWESGRRRLEAVSAALLECGYLPPHSAHEDRLAFRSASLAAWRERFSTWMRNPVENRLHEARPLFDMAKLRGPEGTFAELGQSVRASASQDDFFLRLLAHDCLASLPPLSFFRDLVIEETGERNEVLHLERSALRPLVDVGRVFGIASGQALGGATLDRFERAAAYRPGKAALFHEAAETFRVLLYHQARAGLRRGDAGFEILPQSLSRHDRRVLKTSFRSIARLLEFTAEGGWLRA